MNPEEVFSELNRACLSLLRSVEPRFLPAELHELPIGEIYRFREAIEYLRQPIAAARIRKHRDDPGYLQSVLREFTERLYQVSSDEEFHRITSQAMFRISGPRAHGSGEPILHEALLYSRLPIKHALGLLADSVSAVPLEALLSDEEISQAPPSVRALTRVLPSDQALAPAQFAVEAGRMKVVRQPANPDAEDRQNVRSASAGLLEDGRKIIDELSRSNCDRRLIEGFEELQSRIRTQEDVIRTGITNITCSHLFEQFKNELPNALYGMMQGHSVAVSMYIAQFPEWRRFADQAATANIETSHAPHIAAAARQMAESLNQQPQLADPEVPHILKMLSELVSDPEKAGQRAIFAALRTLENFVWTAYSYAKDLFKKTAEKTVDRLSSLAAGVIVVAVAGALVLAPVVSSLPEAGWVQKATDIVLRELRRNGLDI